MANPIQQPIGYINDINILFSNVLTPLSVTVLILLIGFIIGRIAERLISRILYEFEVDKLFQKRGVNLDVIALISKLVNYMIYFIAIVLALNELGLTAIIVNVSSGIILIAVIIFMLVSLKDFLSNFIAGIFLLRKRDIKKETKIKTHNLEGTVKKVGILETEIRTGKGDILFVPNTFFFKNEFAVKQGVSRIS